MFKGSLVALVTPMQIDGRIDYDRFRDLVEWHVQSGTDAIVAVGTTGESATLSDEEFEEVVTTCVDVAAGRCPVIAGTGSNNTQHAIALSKIALRAGAQAGLSVVPYYNKPTQAGLIAHFSTIADATELPLILYNVPARTVTDMQPETVARLMEHPNIIGIKEATGDVGRLLALKSLGVEGCLLSGDDVTACEFMRQGGDGVISVTANVVPDKMARLCALAAESKWEEAEQLNEELLPLHRALFVSSNPMPVKWALAQMGKIDSGIRLPLVPLNDTEAEPLRVALQQLGLIDA
ncbi:MAG: 4-hydroxy-tetrahydrodipicolinate synthase [Gammaproteobacteria bacterium]|nr:MAG: 4-hydroxy-tetrahydrodipicolinate synthase [Gammaproteobacteria bacterium]